MLERLRDLLRDDFRSSSRWTPPSAEGPARDTVVAPSRDGYPQFLAATSPSIAQLQGMREKSLTLTRPPTISIVVPTYNSAPHFLVDCLSSVLAQAYPHWELCIADDASTDPRVRRILTDYANADPRIKVTYRATNGHISAASNSALAFASGEFVALLDHDDMLPPESLFHVAMALLERPATDMLYSDEDKITAICERHDPFFKPDWSPEAFLSRMYTCHLGVFRTSLLRELGGFRSELDGAQDYDLVLRVTEKTRNVVHLPRVLYHWREHLTSAAGRQDAKPYAYSASRRAIDEALARRGQHGHSEDVPGFPGIYRTRYALSPMPSASIIVDTRAEARDFERCLESLFKLTADVTFEVIAVTHDQTPAATHQSLKRAQERWPGRVKSVEAATPRPADVGNAGAAASTSDVLCFLDGGIEVKSAEWLLRLVEQACQSDIGAVGPRIANADGTLWHCGLAVGMDGLVARLMVGKSAGDSGHRGWGVCTSNISALPWECLAVRRDRFEALGGFDAHLRWHLHDVDFCLRALSKGHRNVLLTDVEVVRHGADAAPPDFADSLELKSRWGQKFWRDPYFNPNLSLGSRWFEVARPADLTGGQWSGREHVLDDAGVPAKAS